MKILEQGLNKIKSINKKHRDFLMLLVQGLIGIGGGKRNFRNLSRYMQITEHTFARQMAKAFDFVRLNFELIMQLKKEGDVIIGVQDSTYIPKSGNETHGIGFCWSGSDGKVKKGLELDVIGAVKVGPQREGYAVSAEQVPLAQISKTKKKENESAGFNKINFSVAHVKKAASALFDLGVKHMVADAFYAKKSYVDGVTSLGFQVVSKLRIDARLRSLYDGPQKSRGRKKKFEAGTLTTEDFGRLPTATINSNKGGVTELYERVVYSESLKRIIKVVLVRSYKRKNKYGEALLFSTDLNLSASDIYEFYVSRFQIEFVFRDAKNFTGLGDCQSRNKVRLFYHFNSSLVALNVAKIQDALSRHKSETAPRPFSMASIGRKYHIEIIINRIISMSGFNQTLIKSHTDYERLLSFGSITH